MSSNTDKRFILLNETDNIFICCEKALANETVDLEGDKVCLTTNIDIGHKLARRNIETGEKIIKYGVSIGLAKTDIQRAEHVHLHNIKSDYIASHIRSGIIDQEIGSTKVKK